MRPPQANAHKEEPHHHHRDISSNNGSAKRHRAFRDLPDHRTYVYSLPYTQSAHPSLTRSSTATCFFLGILFANLPYDYYVLWTNPPTDPLNPLADPRAPYFLAQETHLKFLHSSPPLISRILHIIIGTGLLGLMMKLYKPSEANMLFDGASLVLYMIGVTVYIANIVKGMRVASTGIYGAPPVAESVEKAAEAAEAAALEGDYIGREDSLRVLSASNTILALVLVGILVLQAGQWYAQRKEAEEMEQMDKVRDEKKKEKAANAGGKKKQ